MEDVFQDVYLYRSKSFLNDCRTTLMDSWNIRIRDKFLLLLHMVNLHLIYSPCEIMTINVKSLQTWFIPLTNSTNKIYTFDIQHLGLHQARQQRQGLVSDPDFFRISSTQLSVNVLGNVSYTSCIVLTFPKMNSRQLSRIRRKSGSRTSPCFCFTWLYINS